MCHWHSRVGLQAVDTDNNFQILVDRAVVRSGSLLKDFDPPVNPNEFMVRHSTLAGEPANDVAKCIEWDRSWSLVSFVFVVVCLFFLSWMLRGTELYLLSPLPDRSHRF
jgi:hypothetical protein